MTDHQTDTTGRIAGLLGEHWTAGMAANGAARKWECACGERIAMSDAAHRAHVAAVLAEAGVGVVAEAERSFYTDKATGEPCPTRGALLCTHTNPEHRHIATHMLGKTLVQVTAERDNWRRTFEANIAVADRAERAEAALADLRERVRALADKWEGQNHGPVVAMGWNPAGDLRALLDDGSAS